MPSPIRVPALAATLFAAALLLASPARPAAAPRTEAVYAVPASAQFMNHADDRLRGMSTNPFNVKTEALVINTKGKEKGNGPFPGDDILYSFKLYSSPKPAGPIGRAMFTCYYNFVKRATCDSYFELDAGVLLASGQVVFDGTRFTLAISGGTSRYLGALGEVKATPASGNAERLEIRLLRSKG